MKTRSCKVTRIALTLGSASLGLGGSSILAADGGSSAMVVPPPALRSGLYVGTEVGLNLVDDLTQTINTSAGSVSGSISLSPGVRWDLSMGYAIKLADQVTLGPELEAGIMYNALDTASARVTRLTGSASVGGYFIQVPLMANAVLRWQFSPGWVFYAGGGAGYDYNFLGVDNVAGIGVNLNHNEGDFAWQGMAGIKYAFGASEVGLGYKYLAIQPTDWHTVGNNSLMLSYTLHF